MDRQDKVSVFNTFATHAINQLVQIVSGYRDQLGDLVGRYEAYAADERKAADKRDLARDLLEKARVREATFAELHTYLLGRRRMFNLSQSKLGTYVGTHTMGIDRYVEAVVRREPPAGQQPIFMQILGLMVNLGEMTDSMNGVLAEGAGKDGEAAEEAMGRAISQSGKMPALLGLSGGAGQVRTDAETADPILDYFIALTLEDLPAASADAARAEMRAAFDALPHRDEREGAVSRESLLFAILMMTSKAVTYELQHCNPTMARVVATAERKLMRVLQAEAEE